MDLNRLRTLVLAGSDVEKEDGQNDYVICQLKSTDAQSIKVNQKDIRILEKNARIEHKIPMFAIQFLNTGEVWIMLRPEDISDTSEYILTGDIIHNNRLKDLGINLDDSDELESVNVNTIKSSSKSREKFFDERNKKYDKTRSAK